MTATDRFTLLMSSISIVFAMVGVTFRYMKKVNDTMIRQTDMNERFTRHDQQNKDQIVELLTKITDLHIDMEKRLAKGGL